MPTLFASQVQIWHFGADPESILSFAIFRPYWFILSYAVVKLQILPHF